ncbi:CLIP domain-containing serine protease B9 [Drosophila teissieri]|uniref:CLIP domain-containing serine protease B9 n=1 Tax=Drosophila teissieri TaxID=7243 RepID=UPI001CBA1849|nr:CLIP domain-containing serine protease B9 [Drosophila teissieri]
MSPLQLVTVLLLVSLINLALGQLPRNGCSPWFQYQGYMGQYIGLVKLRHPVANNQTLILQFSQEGFHNFDEYVGSISLVDDDYVTQENLRQGLPIRYRVDFPIPTIPPKITSMQLNGVELCGGLEYPKPRTGITLRITWSPSYTLTFEANPQRVPPRSHPTWPQEGSPQIDNSGTRPSQPRVEDNGDIFVGNNESLPAFQNPGWGTAPQQANPIIGTIPPLRITNPAPPRTTPDPGRSSAPQQAVRSPVELVPQQNPSSNGIPCGRERASITPFIFQGESLQRGQLPWLVAIFERRESNGPAFICGGTLISTSTVLSAAHCFRAPGRNLPASRLAVSLGRNTLAIHSDGEFRGVSQLIIHENFQIKQFTEADLALVRLDEPVRYTDYIVPICLWSTSNRMDLPQGHKSYVAGWGPDETGTGHTEVSKITDLNIVIESNCVQELPHVLVQPSALCAKKTGAGPCASDGGGPLMLREQEVWVLRGVISGGVINEKENTCELSKPSVFTDVAKHIEWVRRNMWN